MEWTTLINEIWNDNSKLMILIVSSLISLIMMIIKNEYDKYKQNKITLESSKIHLCLFLEILISAIFKGDKELVNQHNTILITNIHIIKKDKNLYELYKKIKSFHTALEIENYNTSEKKENAINQLKNIQKNFKDIVC